MFSWISNSESTNFFKEYSFYDFQLSKLGQKVWFGPMRNLFSSSTVLTEYTSWKKLVNQVGESIWRILYVNFKIIIKKNISRLDSPGIIPPPPPPSEGRHFWQFPLPLHLQSYLKKFVEKCFSFSCTRVSIQGVKSLGSHFACLCRGFDFYEVFLFIIISKKKREILLNF